MTKEKTISLIAQGEGINIEFKESKTKISRDVYESVCAMLNRHGGHLFLGVRDDGSICGVDATKIVDIKNDFLTSINNPQKLNPPFYLTAEIVDMDDKQIVYIFIPESSSVHSVNGKIFDRNGDGDFDITGRNDQVSKLYLRKQNSYSENKIFPYATLEDLRMDLIDKVRARVRRDHPWREMDDMSFLRSAGLYKKDIQTGLEGLTLASILLFGKDETIINALPHHRTDAILRRENLDRYDDRDDIRTNLLESYERLMAFVAKHLNDPFYMEGDIRISLRDKIFREAIVNILIHREYSSAYVAKMVIGNDEVVFENANRPHGFGFIDPNDFIPYPKNPTIAKVFKEIDYADELGSGVRNLYKYSKIYGGSDPKLIEEDIFKIIVPLKSSDQVSDQASDQAYDQAILSFCSIPKSAEEIMKHLGLKHKSYFRKTILNPLIEKGILLPMIPDKPTSPNQKYITKGKSL
jgi:ATP-dependent DNA helicase RecG